jgi:hypothetical protein
VCYLTGQLVCSRHSCAIGMTASPWTAILASGGKDKGPVRGLRRSDNLLIEVKLILGSSKCPCERHGARYMRHRLKISVRTALLRPDRSKDSCVGGTLRPDGKFLKPPCGLPTAGNRASQGGRSRWPPKQ